MAERSPEALPQLRAQLRDARHANALLQTEVELFEKWYRKMEPCAPALRHQAETQDAPQELTQTTGRYKSKLHSATDCLVGLTVEQKCELAQWELSEVENEIQRMKEDSEQTLQTLKAVTEEADVWWTDVKQAIRDFENDIISVISCKRGSIIDSQKLLGYMEEKNHQRDLLREKLRLKNYLLKGYKKKLQKQLRQKGQVGETPCEVHLQQLQVRNAQYQKKMGEKNQELLQLKITSAKTVQVLKFYKRKLQDAVETSTTLMKDISQRKQLLEKTEREAALVKEQQAQAESVNWQLQKQLSDHRAPPVLSYLQQKMVVTDLKSSLKTWQRKKAVAKLGRIWRGNTEEHSQNLEMSLQSYHRAWNQVKMYGNQY